MQLSQIVNKLENLNHAWEHYKKTNDEKIQQISQKNHVDPLTENKLRRINDDLNEYKSRLDQIETSLNRPEYPVYDSDKSSDRCEYKEAFIKYLRKGNENAIVEFEKKSLSSSVGNEGGFLIAPKISKKIIQRIKTQSVIRQLASREEISTEVLEIIDDQDAADAGWITEIAERSETRAPVINKKFIRVHELYAQPSASQKLIDDSCIDIEKWIVEKISDRFTALENHSFLHGDGKTQPQGLLLDASLSNIEHTDTNSETITADDIINLYYSLGTEYAAKGTFLMHRNTLQTIRSLKSPVTGQYLWSPGLALGAPDTLLGAPLMQSLDMPIVQKNNSAIIFADFKSAYKIVDRSGIRMIRDPYTNKPFVKFYSTKRVGGGITNSNAAKILKIAGGPAGK